MRNVLITEKSSVMLDNMQEEKTGRLIFCLLAGTCALTLFGVIMLYSTSYGVAGSKYFFNQMVWVVVGSVLALAVVLVGYKKISQFGLALVICAIVMLLVARYCFPPIKGAYRWIRIPFPGFPVNIQPSELAKLALAIYFSRFCAERLRYINNIFTFDFKKLVPYARQGPLSGIAVCGVLMGAVFLGKDLGTTVLLAGVMAVILFCAGMRLRYLISAMALAGISGFYKIKHSGSYRWDRLTVFLDPETEYLTEGYQLWNSFLAFGSGNWLGLGLSKSRLKAKYLPEAHTDFIMSIVGEELGFVAMLLVMFSYFFFIVVCAKISANARTRQAMLLGVALTSTLGMQAIINIGVACGAFPTKGMPAPFISYGGSSMLMCLLAVGLLFSIALDTIHPNYNEDLIVWFKGWLSSDNKAEA